MYLLVESNVINGEAKIQAGGGRPRRSSPLLLIIFYLELPSCVRAVESEGRGEQREGANLSGSNIIQPMTIRRS
jgi:hypothetical protein